MQTILPIDILAIEDDGFHIITMGTINGKKARLVVDTGASRTVFDTKKIAGFPRITSDNFELKSKLSAGLGTNSMESYTVEIEHLMLGDLHLEGYEAVLIDMTHIIQSYEKINLPPIDGVLGGDILSKYQAVLDYGNKELRLISNE
jgi:hypothetical protein